MSKFNWKNIVLRAVLWDGALWVALIVLTLVVGVILSWVYWKDLTSDQESLSSTIRNLALVIGGVVAVLLAIWRSRVVERQAATAQQGLLNERYQRGAEMLGNSILSVRLGGIYALQRLAAEHPEQYHLQIMELFCAFVRFPTYDKVIALHSEVDDEQGEQRLVLRPDVQDTMRFLGSRSQDGIRLEWEEDFKLYLRDANVSNLQTVDANLSRAWLTNANLSNTVLTSADLSGARLRQANLSKSRLRNANLSSASINDANLSSARLSRANLSYALLLRTNLAHAFLLRTNLANTRARFADFSNANFAGANLIGADLEGANLTGASFSRRGRKSNPRTPATGLTQAQLDVARSDPDNPPNLEGVLDAETGEQLVWRGRPLDDDSVEPDA